MFAEDLSMLVDHGVETRSLLNRSIRRDDRNRLISWAYDSGGDKSSQGVRRFMGQPISHLWSKPLAYPTCERGGVSAFGRCVDVVCIKPAKERSTVAGLFENVFVRVEI